MSFILKFKISSIYSYFSLSATQRKIIPKKIGTGVRKVTTNANRKIAIAPCPLKSPLDFCRIALARPSYTSNLSVRSVRGRQPHAHAPITACKMKFLSRLGIIKILLFLNETHVNN